MNVSQRNMIRTALPAAVQEALDRFEVTLLSGPPAGISSDGKLLASILSFKSPQMMGQLMLASSEGFLSQTCPGLKTDETNPKPFIYDWLGELSNLIAEDFKNTLNSNEITINLNPPSISEADTKVLELYSNRLPSETFWFELHGQFFCLLICAEIEPNLNLSLEAKDDSRIRCLVKAPDDLVAYEEPIAKIVSQQSPVDQSPGDQSPGDQSPGLMSVDESDILEFELKTDVIYPDQPLMEPIAMDTKISNERLSAQSGVGGLSNRDWHIESIQTTANHELTVRFTQGVSYTFPVRQLLRNGICKLNIEGQVVNFLESADGVAVEFQGLRIDFHQQIAA